MFFFPQLPLVDITSLLCFPPPPPPPSSFFPLLLCAGNHHHLLLPRPRTGGRGSERHHPKLNICHPGVHALTNCLCLLPARAACVFFFFSLSLYLCQESLCISILFLTLLFSVSLLFFFFFFLYTLFPRLVVPRRASFGLFRLWRCKAGIERTEE